jgi:hypothetical protein
MNHSFVVDLQTKVPFLRSGGDISWSTFLDCLNGCKLFVAVTDMLNGRKYQPFGFLKIFEGLYIYYYWFMYDVIIVCASDHPVLLRISSNNVLTFLKSLENIIGS